MDTTQKNKSTGHNYEEEKHNLKGHTVVYQKIEEILSQDSDGVSILRDVKLKQPSARPLIFWKIRDQLITIKPGENLSSFLNRNPYKKHQRDFSLSKEANKLKFLDEKKTSNWHRNVFYWYKNIAAIEIFLSDSKFDILSFVQSPSIKAAKYLIQSIEMFRRGFEKYPKGTLATKFLTELNKSLESNRFDDSCKGLDYVLKPIKYIWSYLSDVGTKEPNQTLTDDLSPEKQILEKNRIESSTRISSCESLCFNKQLKKKIYEAKEFDKKRNLKFLYKNN